MIVLKWAVRYSVTYVEEFETLERAVEDAFWAGQAGTESFDHMEVLDGGTSQILRRRDLPYWAELDRAERAEWDEDERRPPPVAAVVVRAADGTLAEHQQFAVYSVHVSTDDADVAASRLATAGLTDRVRVVRLEDGKLPLGIARVWATLTPPAVTPTSG